VSQNDEGYLWEEGPNSFQARRAAIRAQRHMRSPVARRALVAGSARAACLVHTGACALRRRCAARSALSQRLVEP
jgi:hypothetical protein